MKKLSLAYFGTPYFSARFLEKLLTDTDLKERVEVKLVLTQPDKPIGRKQIVTPSPVKEITKKYGVQLATSVEADKISMIDLALLYAYGEIIPKKLLAKPKLGFWNIHPSLLPKYRGPSPIATPLINDDPKTGVTLIQMDEQIDHGPIIAQEELPIFPHDRRPDLEIKLTDLGFQIFKKTIIPLINPQTRQLVNSSTEQNHSRATYTKLLKKSNGFILLPDLQKALSQNTSSHVQNLRHKIYNLFRGLSPWPGLWTLIQPKRLNWARPKRIKITDLELSPTRQLVIRRVQLEGKKETDFQTFNAAYRIFLL